MKFVSHRTVLIAVTAGFVAVAVACAAPADVEIPVGRSMDVDLSLAGGVEHPDPHAIVEALRGSGRIEDVSVKIEHRGDAVHMHFDVWGTDLPQDGLADRVRAAVPALANATFHEEALQGSVHSTIGAKLGHELFDLKLGDLDVDAARKRVMEELAKRGEGDAQVDVEKVDGPNGEKGMRIRVEKRVGPDGKSLPPESH